LERNPYGMPFKINRNWLGELLVYVPMEFLSKSMEIGPESSWSFSQWNSFQNQWKLVLGALGQFPDGILKEFLLITMEIGLESSWSISQ